MMDLMICKDGVEVARYDLLDGNDAHNARQERAAFDHAYEVKESTPDAVVTIVVHEAGGVRPDGMTPKTLVVAYDVSDLSEREFQVLSGEAEAQAERTKGDDGHPSVKSWSYVGQFTLDQLPAIIHVGHEGMPDD
jgi:hypothetical protein